MFDQPTTAAPAIQETSASAAPAQTPTANWQSECAIGRVLADEAIKSAQAGLGPLAFKSLIAGISGMSEGRQAGFCARLAEAVA
jgi:hypothetical protein